MTAMTTMQSPSIFSRTARWLRLSTFWRWWTSELAAVFSRLAPWTTRYLGEEIETTELALDANSLRIVDANGNAGAATARPIDLQGISGDALRQALGTALRDRALDLRIVLATALCLQKRTSYPQAIEENLREVVGFDMDRRTPFTAAQVYFDARVASRGPAIAERGAGDNQAGNASIGVELAVVPRLNLDPLLLALQGHGARVRSISLAGDTGLPRFEFLPRTERPPRRLQVRQIINLAIGGLIVLFAAIALLLPIWQKRELIGDLQPLVDKSRAEAESTRRIESEFAQLAQEYNFAVGKKYAAYPVVEIVDELSRMSPDTTWLQNLEMKSSAGKGGAIISEVQATGEAASAAKMIELFEQSKLLQNATQRSQTTRGSVIGTERFQIASEVRARTIPAATGMVLNDLKQPAPSMSPGAATPAIAATPVAAPTAIDTSAIKPAPAASPPVPNKTPTPPATTQGLEPW